MIAPIRIPRSLPGYWMDETSGVLEPAVKAYLTGDRMTSGDIAALRAYLRQWIEKGDWRGDIAAWLSTANELGIDPL